MVDSTCFLKNIVRYQLSSFYYVENFFFSNEVYAEFHWNISSMRAGNFVLLFTLVSPEFVN